MKERLENNNLKVGFVGTMHGMAYDFLSQHKKTKLKIIENSLEIYSELIRKYASDLSYIPLEFIFHKSFSNNQKVREIQRHYREYKKSNGLYDFEDLIIEATSLLNTGKLSHSFKAVLIDEFQDTSPIQMEFVQVLSAQKLFVVGDDWQSIYKFRGAEPSIMLDFQKIFAPSKRLFLTKNFRSQKKIVKFGNRLIKLSKAYVPKSLSAFHGSKDPPICHIITKHSEKKNVPESIKKTNGLESEKISKS